MFKWTAFPFIRISVCLIFGIIAYQNNPELWENWISIGAILLSAVISTKNLRSQPIFSGLFSLLFFAYLGGILTTVSDTSTGENHYSQYDRVDGFVGLITSDNTERDHYYRYDLEIQGVYLDSSFHQSQGKIYCYIKKDSLNEHIYQYGDVIMVNKGYFPVAPPKNPHEFNYQQYLKRQHISSHAFVGHDNVRLLENNPPNPVLAAAYHLRSSVKAQIDEFIAFPRERAIITALMLGIKDNLDDEVKLAYSSAGAMHVLAVSGLHVGIVFIILSFLFKKWKEKKWGNLLFVAISLFVIWMYALITGFTPSVLRAVTMFSVVIISSGFSRRANIYNSLGFAAFVMILYDPYIIYSVGFQLSFAAVIGIVILHPRLNRIFDFSYKVPEYLWSITCVSIAAQMATFPLTMLYFHQFPTYFLVSNLIVIPAAAVMLGLGIAMSLIGSVWPVLGHGLGWLLQYFSYLINELVSAIQFLPYPIFDWLYFDVTDTVLVYAILFFGILAMLRYQFQYVVIAFVSGFVLIGWSHFKSVEQVNQQKIVFYEIDDVIAIDLIDGNEAMLLLDDFNEENEEVIAFQVNPNRLVNGLPKSQTSWNYFKDSNMIRHSEMFDLLMWKGMRVAIPRNHSELEWEQPITADIVYFKSPEDLIPVNTAQVVILGTGFGYWDVRSVKKKLSTDGLFVHSLSQDGFWEYDINESNTLAFHTE